MELRQLRYFVAVAEQGSISGAALMMGVQQPTVSQHIRSLEDRVATNLFERHSRGMRLTDGGRRLLRSAHRIVREIDKALDQALQTSRAEEGHLRLGLYGSLSGGPLRAALQAFHEERQSVTLELWEHSPQGLLSELRDHRIELAVTPLDVTSNDFDTLHLWDEPLIAALPATHPLAGKRSVKWQDLASARLVVRTWESGSTLYAFLRSRIAPDAYLAADQHYISRESLLGLVGTGEGYTVLGASTAGASYPGVLFIPIDEPDATVPMTAVWLKENDNPLRGKFIAMLRDSVRDR